MIAIYMSHFSRKKRTIPWRAQENHPRGEGIRPLSPSLWMPDKPALKVDLHVQPGSSALIAQSLQALMQARRTVLLGV
jgi:hypothetical protein